MTASDSALDSDRSQLIVMNQSLPVYSLVASSGSIQMVIELLAAQSSRETNLRAGQFKFGTTGSTTCLSVLCSSETTWTRSQQ